VGAEHAGSRYTLCSLAKSPQYQWLQRSRWLLISAVAVRSAVVEGITVPSLMQVMFVMKMMAFFLTNLLQSCGVGLRDNFD